jgi:hypothetical protein
VDLPKEARIWSSDLSTAAASMTSGTVEYSDSQIWEDFALIWRKKGWLKQKPNR